MKACPYVVSWCFFAETASGRTQWEPPTLGQSVPPVATPPPQAQQQQQHHGHTKRRQYAAEQAQVYYGAEGGATGGYPGTGYPAGVGAGAPPVGGGQLFTPGLVGENQFAAQQGAPTSFVPAAAPGVGPGVGGAPPPGGAEYINAPGFGQPQAGFQQQMNAVSDQFSQMGIGGQKPFALYTTNLLTAPPDPRELQRPPPEIRLPPNSCISPSPFANSDPSYQRSTINAIPTTSALLNKSKLPFGLILTPYRSLKEGDEPVPLVTDQVIARCRRCRTYINPFVQFIDGGNR